MTGKPARASYHHGALRSTLIAAAVRIIVEQGLERFSLRGACRDAGVTAAAAKHHFGGVAGLLAEVAIQGFVAQKAFLEAANPEGSVGAQVRTLVYAFVSFAAINPDRYRLMFRTRLLEKSERLQAAVISSLERLARLMALYHDIPILIDGTAAVAPQVVAGIALAHRLADFAIEEEFTAIDDLRLAAFGGTSIDEILRSHWPDR